MGIDALQAAIEEEGCARVAALLDDARARAQVLCDEAGAAASARRGEVLRREEAKLRREAAARLAAARSAARKRVLEAREALLDRVFALARDQLPALLEAPATQAWILDLAEQALGHMPEGPVVIECSLEVAETLERGLAGHDRVEVERSPELPGGFRARSRAVALVVDVTLAKLLELRRPTLAIDLLRRLEQRLERREGP